MQFARPDGVDHVEVVSAKFFNYMGSPELHSMQFCTTCNYILIIPYIMKVTKSKNQSNEVIPYVCGVGLPTPLVH